MTEPRRSARARAREEVAPVVPDPPKETPVKATKGSLKRKRATTVVIDSTPSTPAPDGPPLPPKQTLPLKLAEDQPLPTLPEPQPLDLPSSEWQDIQQSGVLESSLERSRAVWTSGVNFRTFHKHFVQPKKVSDRSDEDKAKNQRQKELLRNFPQIGAGSDKDKENVVAKLVIEPHTFNIRLFGPREIVKQVQRKAPTSNYGPWPNHSQHGQPTQYTQYNTPPTYQKPPPQPQPQPRPPPPKPAPPPASTSAPAPDPVIHMLAARAGTDPELKAVMKIVANGSASKEQLEFFQGHINELTAILARQKEQAAKTPKQQPPASTPAQAPAPAPTPKPIQAPPPPRPVQSIQAIQQPPPPPPTPQQQYQQPPLPHTPLPQTPVKPYTPVPPQPPIHHPPPSHQQHPPYMNNYNQPQPYRQPPLPQQAYNPPQRTSYRPLVFEFVEGNNDKLYFPSYSFMEWLPNNMGAKISFLITKMKPQPEAPAKPLPTPVPAKAEVVPAAAMPNIPSSSTVGVSVPNAATPTQSSNTTNMAPVQTPAPPPPTPYVPPPRIEDFDEKNDVANIEFYQPITVLIRTDDPEIVKALPRSIRPPDIVERYMNEVFDNCKRADETYLAFRLPKDNNSEPSEKKLRSEDGTPAVSTPIQDTSVDFHGGGMSALDRKKPGRTKKGLAA
ncbi:hypothetical protein IQ07DRAFT_581966 [Pyrenochaeta sp. DS3sAY3a]|nr:hypothetical protein IQ07DRAFT_581966 [Pyrenochaeta sp. DS3sAY3a]